jgi:hypothetical protein
MDAKQFLKEARELYAKEPKSGITYMPPPEWDYTLDGLKRILGYYSDRTGYFINFFFAFLRITTLTERFTNPDAGIRWVDEAEAARKKAEETCGSKDWRDSLGLLEEFLCEVVLKHIDEIAAISRQSHEEQNAIATLVNELRKYPTLNSDESLCVNVAKSIGLYMDSMHAKADIETYREMSKVAERLYDKKPDLLDMISRCSKGKAQLLRKIIKENGSIEKQLRNAIIGALGGKYVFWDNEDVIHCKYMRIDGTTLTGPGDKSVWLTGRTLHLDYGFCPYFNEDSSVYLSRMSTIEQGLTELHIIDFDELCKLVEKHTPFMLDYIKKLAENEKEKT